MNKRNLKIPTLILYLAIIALLIWAFIRVSGATPPTQISYSEAIEQFRQENVISFTVQDNTVSMTVRTPVNDNNEVSCTITNVDIFREDVGELVRLQYEEGIIEEYNFNADKQQSIFSEVLPYLIAGGILILAMLFIMNRSNGNGNMANFGKASVKFGTGNGKKVTFKDVAGADEEKEELKEIVDYLKNPSKYNAIGAKIPKGVLLVGPPGTGKTLIAKAVAGEANVQFLSISGSDFVEMFVGVGASRVRDLFETAKKLSPAIVFIDEIDAVGRKRGAGLGGGHDEKEQTLNQLLVEMDGFNENQGVIVLAATNRKDILDPALLRPGRFDRQIYIGYPNAKGREDILKVHAKDKPLADNVDLHTVAMATSGFTGASLANLLNEAALLAARNNRPVIAMQDMEEAMMKILAGPLKPNHKATPHEQRLTAYHEAGHAVAMYYLPTHEPVHQITVIPRGPSAGMTISIPDHDRNNYSRNEMFEEITSFLAGLIAEKLEFGDITTGASNDLQRATGIARDMVSKYGMSDRIGTVSYSSDSEVFIGRDYEKTKSYSERTAGEIDDEVKVIIDKAYAKCVEILEAHRDKLTAVAEYLYANDTMSRDQFEACMEGREIPEKAAASLFAQVTGISDSSNREAPEEPVSESEEQE